MGDFSKIEEPIDCPDCNSPINITIEQVANGESVICSNCGAKFRLKDSDGSAKIIDQAMKRLEDALDSF